MLADLDAVDCGTEAATNGASPSSSDIKTLLEELVNEFSMLRQRLSSSVDHTRNLRYLAFLLLVQRSVQWDVLTENCLPRRWIVKLETCIAFATHAMQRSNFGSERGEGTSSRPIGKYCISHELNRGKYNYWTCSNEQMIAAFNVVVFPRMPYVQSSTGLSS